jgi:small redox-active disulfide protein 2
MKIKILGSGCSKCNTLSQNTQTALTNLGLEAQIIKVTDFAEIAALGVMSTPALAIDEKVVSVGTVLSSSQIEKLLQ